MDNLMSPQGQPHVQINIHAPAPNPAPPPPQELHIIHHMPMQMPGQNQAPMPPQTGAMQSSGMSTGSRVDKYGSELEKNAVHATQEFNRRGITVKDSRAS